MPLAAASMIRDNNCQLMLLKIVPKIHKEINLRLSTQKEGYIEEAHGGMKTRWARN